MNQDNELNKMFREGLTEPGHHAEYREADWEALEQMLDERQKKARHHYFITIYRLGGCCFTGVFCMDVF